MKIELNDFSKDYLPFKFKGFWNVGYCFLRIVIKNGKVTFLCSQLPDYTGTSITNAIESVLEQAVHKLHNEKTEDGSKVVSYKESFSFIRELIFGKKNEDRLLNELRNYILSEAIWIEHYPPSEGLFDEGSFSLVNFTDSGEPIWNYIEIGSLEKELSAPNLFSLQYDDLKEWNTKKV